MVIDVHCHVGLSARRVVAGGPRFSFEAQGAAGSAGFDSYLSPRLLRRAAWLFVRRWLGIDRRLGPGEELDAAIERVNERHFAGAVSADRLVLLAFDEYHDDAGKPVGAAEVGQGFGSDLYVSNSFVRGMCAARPERFLFGASIHPYRADHGDACAMLEEVSAGGAVLIKWLPIHQNIRAEDPRTVAFLRRAAELKIAMLIHYGGEMSLSRQHMEFESPAPMLRVLRELHGEGCMPTVIVAHAATPSFPWQSRRGHDALIAALERGDGAPLYADISALAAFGRTRWLKALARRTALHGRLLWGTDFPIPVMVGAFRRRLSRATRRRIAQMDSWIEQDYQLKRALGFEDRVFTQAARVLGLVSTD